MEQNKKEERVRSERGGTRDGCAVGGNHEAVNHLWELYYGGWVAPNIYYMGSAGVVNFGPLRIAGISGVYNEKHYSSGHHETPPYDNRTVKSAYYVRDLEVYRLLKVRYRYGMLYLLSTEPSDVVTNKSRISRVGDPSGNIPHPD